MEEILAEELIPQYQRAVVVAFPDIAQSAAQADGRAERRSPTTAAARCSACSGGPPASRWAATASDAADPHVAGRRSGARHAAQPGALRRPWPSSSGSGSRNTYLDEWNNQTLPAFDQQAQDVPVRRPVAELHLRLPGALLKMEYPDSRTCPM